MGRLYIDRKYFAKSPSKWVSFESNPGLERTKKDIYGRCVPCMTGLYEQLKEGKTEINLGNAYQCWKLVVPFKDIEECTLYLYEFEKDFLQDMNVKGRFGSGDPSKTTKVIVFNAESEEERDRLYSTLAACALRTNPEATILVHRACADLYHELLGNWRGWSKTEPIRNPAMVKTILERIKRALFWEKESTSGDSDSTA
jgi:hypothetical protein